MINTCTHEDALESQCLPMFSWTQIAVSPYLLSADARLGFNQRLCHLTRLRSMNLLSSMAWPPPAGGGMSGQYWL